MNHTYYSSTAFAQQGSINGTFSISGIFLLVDSEVSGLVQLRLACFVVSSSSHQQNVVWSHNDFCSCIFAHPALSGIINTDYASYIHPFDVRNWLRLLWQAMCRHTGRKWLCVAFILGDSMPAAFLIDWLHVHIVLNPSWTTHQTAIIQGEYNLPLLDSQNFVLWYFACGSTIVLWLLAFCEHRSMERVFYVEGVGFLWIRGVKHCLVM